MQNRRGIYTLANDAVFDQLVALLNSIEANYGGDVPVCVIPYDDKVDKVREEIAKRPQVTLFDDAASIARWEKFAKRVWSIHPHAPAIWKKMGVSGTYRIGMHRRYCAFDGPFEQFVTLDADILVMRSLDFIFDEMADFDVIGYDYQFKDPSHVYNVKSSRLYDVFTPEQISANIICAGFFASKRALFGEEDLEKIFEGLRSGDAEILYPYGPDQTLLNYMFMKSGMPVYNFALHLPQSERTGNAVTSTHFEAEDDILYDKGNRLTYLHYIGIPAAPFRRLCAGENIDFPYRDIFLHYRYLNEPEKRPVLRGKAVPYNRVPGLAQRIWNKVVRRVTGIRF